MITSSVNINPPFTFRTMMRILVSQTYFPKKQSNPVLKGMHAIYIKKRNLCGITYQYENKEQFFYSS
jgi:hypothetical protein